MSEDSKKRQQLKKQIENKAQVLDIKVVEKVANYLNSPKKWDIVEKIATIQNNLEAQRFVISFDYLNWKECVFEHFDPTKGKKLLEILDKVSKCQISKFPELRLIRDSVGRIGAYQSLFNGLSKEVDELKEIDFCDGRIFFFITEPYFNIVSVETKHRNID
jgi:hypothetical protein